MFGQCDGLDKEMTWWLKIEQWRLLVLSLARTLTLSCNITKCRNTNWRNRQRGGLKPGWTAELKEMRISDKNSSWRLILSHVAQVSLSSSALLNISMTGLGDGTECTLSSSQMTQNWENLLTHQLDVLPFRGTWIIQARESSWENLMKSNKGKWTEANAKFCF